MKNKKAIFLNGAAGGATQIIAYLMNFITRTLMIKYIGIEVLGISSTCASVMGTLQLADIGFQNAVCFSLYKPIAEQDEEKINNLLQVLKTAYLFIALFVAAGALICLPFLKYIFKGVEVNAFVIAIFLLTAANVSVSYYMAHKRTLLYADQHEYNAKVCDIVTNLTFSLLRIVAVVVTHNFIWYVVLQIMQTFSANVLVSKFCKKRYPYLHRSKPPRELFAALFSDVKNIFFARMAGYVYSSTDNLVISSLISTVTVGFTGNYTMFTSGFKTICSTVLVAFGPYTGNLLTEGKDPEDLDLFFRTVNHLRFAVAAAVVIPCAVLFQDLIRVWIGEDYLLSIFYVYLLLMDFYIETVDGNCLDFIYGSGLFLHEKRIDIAGALTNIILSVILALKIGICGVLIGTVVSQMIFWIGRSLVCYSKCIDKKYYGKYLLKNLIYIIFVIINIMISGFIYSFVANGQATLLRLLAGGVICELVYLAMYLLLSKFFPESEVIFAYFKRFIKREKI